MVTEFVRLSHYRMGEWAGLNPEFEDVDPDDPLGQAQGCRVLWLIEADFAAAGQLDRGLDSPLCLLNR